MGKSKIKTNNQLPTLALVLAAVLVLTLLLEAALGNQDRDTVTPEQNVQESTGETEQVVLPEVLTVLTPGEREYVTFDSTTTIAGTSDPRQPLTINGEAVTRQPDGSFTYELALAVGENIVTVSHKEQTVVYTVLRRFAMESCEPLGNRQYGSGATVYFKVSARKGSTVTATFNGKMVTLEEDPFQLGNELSEGFALYVGTYKLPSTNTADKNMGSITYTVVYEGVTETCTSGTITCLKTVDVLASNKNVTPGYGDYINVGSGCIAEVVGFAAETFNGSTVDAYSHPTNNYLPEGTVDYCSSKVVTMGNLSYVVLRSGQRVYLEKKNSPTATKVQVVDQYRGKLPDHNELTFVSLKDEGSHTVLTLECLWKAPFYFDLLPQKYFNATTGSNRNYTISKFTAEYVDITFCYTPGTYFTGTVTVPEDNPLFRSAELISQKSDCILRLYLKKTGGFYGWDAYYDDQDRLCFRFLNPARVTESENALGADLSGVKVFIDVGHGGSDPGTARKDSTGQEVLEADRNLALALKLRQQLEAAGATVILDRTTDIQLTMDERAKMLRQEKPDICISIHHNSIDGHPDFGGFESFYYTPFAHLATKLINDRTEQSAVYDRAEMMWHTFFLARQTVCPVVLAENGYMSCNKDLEGTLDEKTIEAKALAIARGVADYFLQINQ